MKNEWKISFVNQQAEKEIIQLSPEMKSKLIHILDLFQEFGPLSVGLPHTKPLGNKLWEIRIKGKGSIARSIYVLCSERRVILLHTFVKKTQKAPKKSLKIALERLKEIEK